MKKKNDNPLKVFKCFLHFLFPSLTTNVTSEKDIFRCWEELKD